MSNDINTTRATLIDQLDKRLAFEQTTNMTAQNKKKISDLRDMIARSDDVVSAAIACNIDATIFNRELRKGNRFNVYAIEKIDNLLAALSSVSAISLNHYTRHCVATMLALNAKDMSFTSEDAKSACSVAHKNADSKKAAIVKKTCYQRNCASGTVNSQSSSSIQALEACKLVVTSRDSSNREMYKLNENAALAAKLVELSAI